MVRSMEISQHSPSLGIGSSPENALQRFVIRRNIMLGSVFILFGKRPKREEVAVERVGSFQVLAGALHSREEWVLAKVVGKATPARGNGFLSSMRENTPGTAFNVIEVDELCVYSRKEDAEMLPVDLPVDYRIILLDCTVFPASIKTLLFINALFKLV